MRIALLVSGILELIGGMIIYFKPDLIFANTYTPTAKFFGLAAFVIGMINIFSYQEFNESPVFKKIFLTMMGYHAAIAMICFGMSPKIMHYTLEATLTHLACFVLFFIMYMKAIPKSQ
ncbi:MAG: hypothetical protein HKO66_07875 [Saprospiraceae bacterium]|nr:hypothetical protein [Bacteroidia bacterium]NNE14444.1 hypothetical protein [Saprospiraceae bacterium]NNL92134.1 hypothetical protein [Saprospiraceae bacterium]